jgi:pantoate--beta-alanine ligase
MQLYQLYAEGNAIEATEDTPFLQIGEPKYGKPILDRAISHDIDLVEALKLGLISMDSTLKSNLGVGLPIDIVVAPTVREADGLALSSRNTYLDAAARQSALALVESLKSAARAFAAGEADGAKLTQLGNDSLARHPEVAPDYFAVVDPIEMKPVEKATSESVAIVAARVGKTRLIDNMILGEAK